AKVRGLFGPVRLEHRDMVLLQRHFRMLSEGLASGRVLVLRADGEHDSTLPEIEGEGLDGEEGFARRGPLPEHDSIEPVIADHAAPERIVEIEDQNLPRLARERA